MTKRFLLPFLFCCLFLISAPLGAAVSFSDIGGHWAESDILYAAENEILQGYPDGTFLPQKNITRGELVTILANDAKVDLSLYQSASGYLDVDSHWARSAIVWGTSVGVVNGYADHSFGPDRSVTRQELSVMLYRYVLAVSKVTLPQTNPSVSFGDSAAIGSWAKTAVTAMQQAGIVNGDPDGSFYPQRTATRAEATTMLARYLRIVNHEDAPIVGSNRLYVNGSLAGQINVASENGVSYVPARAFFEALGYRVLYYNTAGLLAVCNHEKDMELWLGKTEAYVKTARITLAAAPKLINGSTYVPLGGLSTPLGLSVRFQSDGAIYVTHTAAAVNLSALSFYGSANAGSAVNGQINFGDTQGFIGTVSNGKMQYGSYTLTNRTSYFGNWADGTFSGNGTMVNFVGDLSFGTFAKGVLVSGTTIYSDGSRFSGTWNHNSAGGVYPDTGQYTEAGGKTYGGVGVSWSGGSLRIP